MFPALTPLACSLFLPSQRAVTKLQVESQALELTLPSCPFPIPLLLLCICGRFPLLGTESQQHTLAENPLLAGHGPVYESTGQTWGLHTSSHPSGRSQTISSKLRVPEGQSRDGGGQTWPGRCEWRGRFCRTCEESARAALRPRRGYRQFPRRCPGRGHEGRCRGQAWVGCRAEP